MVELREDEAMAMVRHCMEYRTLSGKRDQLHLQLSERDRELLDELDHFFSEHAGAGPRGVPEFARRDFRRRPLRLEVEFRGEDGCARDGMIGNLSGGGLFIETDQPLVPGSETVLRIFGSQHELRFGASVAWVHAGGMGVRFVGIPLEVRLGHRGRPLRPIRRAA